MFQHICLHNKVEQILKLRNYIQLVYFYCVKIVTLFSLK